MTRWSFGRLSLAWCAFGIVLTIFIGARFVGPRIPDDEQRKWCAVNIHLTAVFGVSMGCDGPEFMRVATHPSALLEANNMLQSKPGMPVAAWIVALPLQPLAALVPALVKKADRADIDPNRVRSALQTFGPAFVAYLILNVTILLSSFYLFRRITGARPNDTTATTVVSVSIATLMIATFPLTNYLLTPHTQIFNTLVPLLALYWAGRANTGAILEPRFALAAGSTIGLGATAYGLFYAVLPAVLLFAGLHFVRHHQKVDWRVFIANTSLLVLLSVAPMALWYLIVVMMTGHFHYHEVENANSVIWIWKALREGVPTFVVELFDRIVFYVRGLVGLLPMIALSCTVTAAALIAAGNKFGSGYVYSIMHDTWLITAIALTVGLIMWCFYIGVGQFQIRHAYAAIPPIVAALGTTATTLSNRLPAPWQRTYACACAMIAAAALVVGCVEGRNMVGDWFD